MKLPLSWLKEWVPVAAAGGEEIAHRLTFAGLEVEGIANVEGEPVLEVNVTPNRGDCLSVRGLAREIAALHGVSLKTPWKSAARKTSTRSAVGVAVARPKSCPRYALAVVEGVSVGPSPAWLARRLAQTGVRSVNNVVDVTNYVLMELGQPLHAFDRAKLKGGKIAVRNAKDGEVLRTLDGIDRKLEAQDLVIADADGPVALAGVMGGAGTEVDASTSSVALECAYFDPSVVRRAARRLGIQSESSYRFERGVDPEDVPVALRRAVDLLVEVAGGREISTVDLYREKVRSATVRFRPAEVSEVLGGVWKEAEIRSSLTGLGFSIKAGAKGEWRVGVPSRRRDVSRSVDLIEEVARARGLDRIGEKFPALADAPEGGTDLSQERRARALLADLGLQETVHYSFTSPETAGLLGGRSFATLANPLGRDDSVLRASLLPSLLTTAAHHARHKMETFRAFELRTVFEESPAGKPAERKKLAGVLMGRRLLSHWSDGVRESDFYDLKGVIERILDEFGLLDAAVFERGSESHLHPGQQARVTVDGRTLGAFGVLHPDVLARLDVKKSLHVFELDWPGVAGMERAERRYREFPRTPMVERDLAVVVEEGTEAGALVRFIRRQDHVITDARVFDLYRGGQIAAGKKSLAFSIRMGRPDRTLTDPEINEVFQKVVQGVCREFGAEIR
ncbi:MAG TPA: phenylalanine--tRNA ligase subunit beta [bacterium]|nr:phenylalanine--tRNA ligase subunit beta [bacterium]